MKEGRVVEKFRHFSLALLLLLALAGPGRVQADSPYSYATLAGAGWYHVSDQIVNVWGMNPDPPPEVIAVDSQHNVDLDVIQGPDQNWGGTANIQPGYVTSSYMTGPFDNSCAGWGGAASGGTLIVGFDRDFLDGSGLATIPGYQQGESYPLPEGADFVVYGFGFSFNQAFSAERGTVRIYAATAGYNPTVTGPDTDGPGPLGEVTIVGDEDQWVLLSEWQGWGDWDNDPGTPDTWQGNPDHNYASAPGNYGLYLWGDLADGGLVSARYIKIELGDGGYYVDAYTGRQNNGRALFVDAVKTLYHRPLAHAGGNRQVNVGNRVELDGSDSEDVDEDPLTYQWRQTGGPDVALEDPATATAGRLRGRRKDYGTKRITMESLASRPPAGASV
jgi:hypothetical protein